MRSDMVDDFFLDAGLANETEPALGQVPHPAVKQAAGTATGPESKVVLFDEGHTKAPHSRIPRNARANDAAAYDQQVERRVTQRLERRRALLVMRSR